MRPAISFFPDPSFIDPHKEIVAVGPTSRDGVNTQILYEAYEKGIFPWPISGLPLTWFCPMERGILKFSDLHIPKSLRQFIKKTQNDFQYTIDQSFRDVIQNCAKVPRKGEPGTWITPVMIEAYDRFHQEGHAHSIEVWKNSKLVGGIYGTFIRGIFSAESMFHLEPNTSKLALLFLIEHLQSKGLTWMDIQMVTEITKTFGGTAISRLDFLDLLKQSQNQFDLGKIAAF